MDIYVKESCVHVHPQGLHFGVILKGSRQGYYGVLQQLDITPVSFTAYLPSLQVHEEATITSKNKVAIRTWVEVPVLDQKFGHQVS